MNGCAQMRTVISVEEEDEEILNWFAQEIQDVAALQPAGSV